MTTQQTIHLAGHDPEANLEFEQNLFDLSRSGNRAHCLFYTNSPCVILGRNNQPEEWVDPAATQADGVPILRRFSGGGTVYHDLDTLNYSFIAPRSLLDAKISESTAPSNGSGYIDFFRDLVISALEQSGPGFSSSRVSDISLNGRKISGNAQRIAGKLILHHGTILTSCPLDQILKYLPIPPNRPGIGHHGFITGLAEENRMISISTLKAWISSEFWSAMN